MTHKRVDKADINPLSLESAFSVLRSPFSVLRYVTSRNSSPLTLAILALLCIALTFTACPAGDSPGGDSAPDTPKTLVWRAVADSPLVNDIYGIAYGNGRYVAVGNGAMATSTNGTTWTPVTDTKFGGDMINAVAFGAGKFVAVGRGEYNSKIGKIATSTNGTTWTTVNVSDKFFIPADEADSYSINAIAFGNGRFVAGGWFGKMAYSTDGTNWTSVDSKISADANISYIIFANNKFVAVGSNGFSNGGKMATSPDGTTWTAVTDSTVAKLNNIRGIAYGNGKYVVVNYSKTSSTERAAVAEDVSSTWTAVPASAFPSTLLFALAFGGGTFVVGGNDNDLMTSTDGETWTVVSPSPFVTADLVNTIAFVNNRFIVGGAYGGIVVGTFE